MIALLTFLADFAIALFTSLSGFVGVFLFLLMILTGWLERKHKPRSSNLLVFGGMGMLIIWLWTRIGLTIGSAMR
ncbi:MAG: hypothetical protein AABX53_01240 [Nanoarchaeota archaeon]